MFDAEIPPALYGAETQKLITSSSSSELIGGNSVVYKYSDETQALIDAMLQKPALKKQRVQRKREPRPKPTGVFAQPPSEIESLPKQLGQIPEVSDPIIEVSPILDIDDALSSDSELLPELSDDYDDVDLLEDANLEVIGVDPSKPTKAKPGSEEKVLMLAARYAAGMPLWHSDDVTDYEPSSQKQELQQIADASFDVTNAKKKQAKD